jgi:hypothetical protein
MPNASPTAGSASEPPARPGLLYLLAVGMLLGVLLGPAVLGRFAPALQDRWRGTADADARITQAQDALESYDRATDALIATVPFPENDASGDAARRAVELERAASPEAAELRGQLRDAQQQVIVAGAQARQRHVGTLAAVMLALVAVAAVQAGAGGRIAARLRVGRYALLALWLGLALMWPAALTGLNPWLVAGLILVAIGASLVPLRSTG